MSRRRRRKSNFLRGALGLLLLPTALAMLAACAHVLANLFGQHLSTFWFLAGLTGYALMYLLGFLRLKPAYVFGHELTHALAAWCGGGKVYDFVVKRDSGHVDLSHMSGFIALAPYWVPLYAVGVIAAYRMTLWFGNPAYVRETFLFCMGAALSFHLVHTLRSLWVTHQSDLDHLGLILSMSLIMLLNGAVLLASLKCLFPRAVSATENLQWVGGITRQFWLAAAEIVSRLLASF